MKSKKKCFRPKIDHERSKNAADVGKSLDYALTIANWDVGKTLDYARQLQSEISIKQTYDLNDRKQDPIGTYQESKKYMFLTRN